MIVNHSVLIDTFPRFSGENLCPYRLTEKEFDNEWRIFNFKGRGLRIPASLSDYEMKLIKFLFTYSGNGKDSVISCPRKNVTYDKEYIVTNLVMKNVREYASFMMRYKFANVVQFDKDTYDASGRRDQRDLRSANLNVTNRKLYGKNMPLITCINTIGFSDEQYRYVGENLDFTRFKNQTFLLIE